MFHTNMSIVFHAKVPFRQRMLLIPAVKNRRTSCPMVRRHVICLLVQRVSGYDGRWMSLSFFLSSLSLTWDYGDEWLFSWVCCQLQQVFLCCGSSSARYRINHNDCYEHILVYFPVSQCHINFHGVSQGCYSDVIKLYTEINWYDDWN